MDARSPLRHLTPAARQLVEDALPGTASIPADTVGRAAEAAGLDLESLMIALLPAAARHARVPVSGFRVGAIALGGSGSLHLGANMEFAGQALGYAVHGEQSAITTAWLAGETDVRAVAVNAAPCGHCRQFLHELRTPSEEIDILIAASTDATDLACSSQPLSHLLPRAFGPSDLGIDGGLLEPDAHGLTTPDTDPLTLAALAAANASYAPYTGDFAGCAIRLANGTIYTGRVAGNAAFNPSMSPLASAVSSMNMAETPGADYDLTDAVLVETHAVVSQRSTAEAVLASVAPDLTLRHVLVEAPGTRSP